MNSRRKSLIALGATVSLPRLAFAQAKKPPVVIGWLAGGSRITGGDNLSAFKEGFAALGWREGLNYVIEERWAEGGRDRLSSLAEQLATRKPTLIVSAGGGDTAVAANRAAPQTPIVMVSGTSPVAAGLATSLARPGGMVTGVTNITYEISEKFLELLLAAAPKVTRVGFLVDPGATTYAAQMKGAQRAIEHYRVEARFAEAAEAKDLEAAITRLAKDRMQGLIVMPSGWFGTQRTPIVKLALEQNWPVVAGPTAFADEGALLSYGADGNANYRRAAYYVDRILKGARPSDLPIEQPTTFEMVVNMKTAKALGLTMPREIMVRATRVIQ
jgi:putative ABC transport system substrate-binding protein